MSMTVTAGFTRQDIERMAQQMAEQAHPVWLQCYEQQADEIRPTLPDAIDNALMN